ncbi:hypothetical protein M9H77_00186 [Catharanthus roseus]|nr:hypothetical protein M9H77_00186 [Catharanthus roseus]
MEAEQSLVDKLQGIAKSTQDFAYGVLHWPQNSNRRNPIEILKRLQREAFSDIMKLRDRQEKVEQLLSFYKASKGSPFQEASTHVRGEVEVAGALLMIDNIDQQSRDTVQTAGIRTGVDLRFVFESTIRQKDTLVTEFVSGEKGQENVLARSLSLAKVLYVANVNNWFSAVAIPVGGQCRDVGVATSSSHQGKGLTQYSAFGPPFLNQHNGTALGVMVRKSNVVASIAQFVSAPLCQTNSARFMHCFSTFGQVVCRLSQSTKFSLLGVHKVPKFSNQRVSFGAMAVPLGVFKQHKRFAVEEDGPQIGMLGKENLLDGSVAMMLESELDESTRISGWIEMKQSNSKCLQWAVSVSDTPEDDFGWGLKMGGLVQGPRSWDYFQVEAFLNFNIGKRFRLKPTALYLADGGSHFPVLVLQSSWSL